MKDLADYREEKVMVVPTAALWEHGYFQGFSADVDRYIGLFEEGGIVEFRSRREVETDREYKQVIPYVLLTHSDTIFSYRRGKMLKEERLEGSCSIGLGGHISTCDINLFESTYKEGMRRELSEEVDIAADYTSCIAGLINEDGSDVGKVHVGVVHVCALSQPLVTAREKSINEGRFLSVEQLREQIHRYENWSQICIRNLDAIRNKLR